MFSGLKEVPMAGFEVTLMMSLSRRELRYRHHRNRSRRARGMLFEKLTTSMGMFLRAICINPLWQGVQLREHMSFPSLGKRACREIFSGAG